MESQAHVPECKRYGVLMRWHSEHRVMDRDRPALMQVFQCTVCDRLRAAEGHYGPAG